MAALPTNRTVANTPNEHVADHNVVHATHNLIDASGLDATDLAALNAATLGAWTSFTPTLTQSATVTKTVTYAKYARVGRTIVVVVDLAVTGAGTAANAVLIGLPVTASATGLTIGSGLLYDTSTGGTYRATCEISTTTTVMLRGSTSTALDALGTGVFTAALAAGDIVRYCATYEALT